VTKWTLNMALLFVCHSKLPIETYWFRIFATIGLKICNLYFLGLLVIYEMKMQQLFVQVFINYSRWICKNAGGIKMQYLLAHTHSQFVSPSFINILDFKNMSVTSCCVSWNMWKGEFSSVYCSSISDKTQDRSVQSVILRRNEHSLLNYINHM